MSLENSLQEIGAGLNSNRANERKKNAEALKKFLDGNSVPALLNTNTKKNKGYNWSNVFHDINEYVLKELEKYETSKTFFNVTAPLCKTLLHLCLAGSNKGQAYICCENVMEVCLYILKDKRMSTAIGDAYLQLLYKYVLPYDHYVNFITPATWEDLLDVSIKASLTEDTNDTKLDKYTLLRLICSIIKKGTSCSQFVMPLRNALPQLKESFLNIGCDKKKLETVVEIATVLLEKLSSEGHMAMCEFTESIVHLLLKYDQNAEQKKKSAVFRLLHLIIRLHHPEGKLQGDTASFAHNWSIWNKCLTNMMDVTCREANYLQKIRKPADSSSTHCMEYFSFAASVYFQVLNMPSHSADDTANLPKRQRVSVNNNKCFSDLIEELRLNCVPWLGIINSYVQHYGKHVTAAEYMTLLNVAESLISNNNSNCSWNIFEQMTWSILKNLMKASCYDENMLNQSLVALWNACVRNSTTVNNAHEAMHSIMQTLLKMNVLQYETVLPLLKLYFEKGMPATDSSLNTLSCVYHKYYTKCSNAEARKQSFIWFIQGNIALINVKYMKDFFARLIANKNLDLKEDNDKKNNRDALYEALFHCIEKNILFSAGDLEIMNENLNTTHVSDSFEINVEMSDLIRDYLLSQLSGHIEKLKRREIGLLDFIRHVHVVVEYVDVTLQACSVSSVQIEEMVLYCCLKTGLKSMCQILSKTLKGTEDVRDKTNLLQCMQELWLSDYDPIVNSVVRMCVDQDFFSSIIEILSVQVSKDDDEAVYEENDAEYNNNATKHNCIWLLAAYCRKRSEYRKEILDLILDPELYDFTVLWDIKCAFRCIRILIGDGVEECPLASVFDLLRKMCKALYRNSEATEKILLILLDILDRIWEQDATQSEMQQDCFIMFKSYLYRCKNLYYPPHVAALIFKCVARITELDNNNNNSDVINTFKEAITNQMRGSTHSLRLYTCYLMSMNIKNFSDTDIDTYFTELLGIFVINVSDTNELVIKDESINRTLTFLHGFFAVVQVRHSLIHRIVRRLLEIQKEKTLDATIVKKFLNKITKSVTGEDNASYFQDNILSVINFWLSRNKKVQELPLEILGFQNIDSFVEKHMKWIISADIIWINEGDVKKSIFLRAAKNKLCKSEKDITEMCFSNIISLCLPYIVTEKYNLNFSGTEQNSSFAQSMKNANKMLITTRAILGNENWSNLFVETMPELLLLSAMHLRDQPGARELFKVDIPRPTDSYLYPKAVFDSILRYFGELIDGNIMQYLCLHQAITIFDILYKLWDNVLQEKVFEFRVLSLYTFITFVECVPLGFDSDAFVANFTCNSLTNAIKTSCSKDEMRILTQALMIVRARFLPQSIALIRKSMLKALSVLLIKKEEGFDKECKELLKYLTEDMKTNLKENEDLVDFRNASHGSILSCASSVEFCERLKDYSFTLTCPSHEALSNLWQFVKLNKHHVNKLCEELNTKHFSEECKTSVVHQVIYALTNIMKSSSDDKIIVQACNCLAEIGTYDLKTIVTVPPPDTKRVIHLAPMLSFAFDVVAILSEVLCDENPAATNKAVAALNDFFKYREGKDVLDLGDVNKQLLKPFLPPNCNENDNDAVFKLSSRKLENCSDLGFWIPKDKEDHIQWLFRITTALLDILESDTNYLNSLKDVCIIKPTICQHILPGLFGLLLHCSPDTYVQIFSNQLNNFFLYIWKMDFDDELDSSGGSNSRSNVIDHHRKTIIQYVIDIVSFGRLQRTHYKPRPDRTPVDAQNYLRLDYDKVAWAASVADQNLVAIYYGELWAVARNGGIPPPSPERTTNLDGGDNIQRIFRKCFVSIGEMDALDGCGTAHLTSAEEKRKHLINTGQYADALLSHDIALSRSGVPTDTDLQLGVVRSLYKSGMHHLALQYIKSLPENDQLNDVKYDCLTCLGDWSNFVDTKDLEKSKNSLKNPRSLIKALRYACLRDCLNVQTGQHLDSKLLPLDRAKLAISRWCQNVNMENCQNVYRVVANLNLFNDIENYLSVRSDKLTINGLLDCWKVDKLPPFNDFKHLESLISQRSLILEHAGKTYKSFLKDIVSLQLQYAEFGLSNGRLQMAQRLLSIAKNLQDSDAVSLVESRVSWAKGHRDIALSLIRMMGAPTDDVELNAASLRQYGMWMAESKFDNPRDIINKCLKKSLDVLAGSDHWQTRLQVYHDIAKFADSEYKQVVIYMNSSIFEHKLKCMENMKDTANSLRNTSTQQQLTRDEKKYLATTQGLSNLDEADIANTKLEKQRFLLLAMRYYLLSLKHCEENNLSVFRVISLWLANPSLQLDEDGDSFEALLHAVPSRKFIAVLPQIVPRLAQETGPFADNLIRILKRCAKEHPHHSLPILFSLKNSDKDMRILNASRHASGASPPPEPPEPRVGAAEALVAALATQSAALAAIIAQMERMCDATISFANYNPKDKAQKQKIPSAEMIHKLGPLNAIPVPIDTIPVRHDCNYACLPTLQSFDSYFELVGGINCPKKINCRSSDGKRRIVLIKGEDDLRQDAVMQQVFNIVNTLLEKNPVTSRNKLLIRTYKVVPMSRQSGVLEWCEGTLPLGAYLAGNGTNGAHARYRPKDISCTAARAKFKTIQEGRRTLSEKLAIYTSILKNFKPVFHNFFTEHYLDPVTWYERRLAYTKSVATSSMIGYILGLGDRHVQNILIDQNTAEVVHIDFGIAFDQGKALPTPETIPFRLTQDMVAGFGSSGVEGIFRKSCEKTMQLLRDNHETLLTILEVLLCDPLYAWTTRKLRLLRPAQKDLNLAGPGGSVADLAQRALLAVGSKLHGTEGGAAGGVAVPGQVARLIQSATDPVNLCRLFHGWQPYL